MSNEQKFIKFKYEFFRKFKDKKPKFEKIIIARTREDADNQAQVIAEQTSTFYTLKEEQQ